MADSQHNEENISKRLAALVVTRSPAGGEIPKNNLAESDEDERARGQQPQEQGDAGEGEQQG